MNLLQNVGNAISSLRDQVDQLAEQVEKFGMPRAGTMEWYQLMTQKLIPQLQDSTYLVVAVVGGTNIGKSVIFNHLCGARVSATSPLASGTKHPTCLVPTRLADESLLQDIFSEFELRHSTTAEDALELSKTDTLFWRESSLSPENLLILDSPDIDSDAEVNWDRADKVRRSADVLIAVLTQQKYNDAAVKKFFRAATEEQKSILIIFNQLLLPDDEPYWPIWLETFCEETGASPEYVYVAPHDRQAAEGNELPFFQRDWPVSSTEQPEQSPRNLMIDLSQLKFDDIKLKSLSGALATLSDREQGIPSYLLEIRRHASIYEDARNRLTERLQEISVSWPVLPNRVVVNQVRSWWRDQRTGWQASVHQFYDTLGRGLMWPIRQLQQHDPDAEPEWLVNYRQLEWQAVQLQLTGLFDRLESLAEHGHPVLGDRLNQLLAGQSRETLIQILKQEHQQARIEQELHQLVLLQMQQFQQERSDWYQILKRLDTVAAAARPAVTVALFATGFGPVGNAVMPVMTDTAMQAALHVAGDVTAGTVTAAVGETAISSSTSAGVRYLEAWFHRFHRNFAEIRKTWLLTQLQQHLWGHLLDDLLEAAQLPQSAEFSAIEQSLSTLCEFDLRKTS